MYGLTHKVIRPFPGAMSMRYRHLLMVYPEFPKTYWGMQYFLPLIGKKALMPPLGLITIGALTPNHYEIRLVDLNCQALTEDDLGWADVVCSRRCFHRSPRSFKWPSAAGPHTS